MTFDRASSARALPHVQGMKIVDRYFACVRSTL
jgi:hypothetical protein